MRFLRRRGHLDRHECGAIISAAATLSSMFNFTWRVADRAPGQSLSALADSLIEARRNARPFLLPEQARHWLDLRYDVPDTGYALALVLVWSFAAAGVPAGEASAPDHVRVAMWQLRHLLPGSAHRALPDIEDAFGRHDCLTGAGTQVR